MTIKNATAQTETAPVADEGMKAKIAALLAKATVTDNEHEAEAFMTKAMELMAKYQLQHWELRDKEDPMGMTPAWATNKNPVTWKKYLINAIANYYGASCMMTATPTGVRFDFVGRESARITAGEMYPFIVGQCKAAGAKLFATDGDLNAKRHTRKVSHALSFRLTKLVAERLAAELELKGKKGEMALTKVDELTAYLATLNLGTAKSGKIGSGGSRHKDAAANVKLEKQVAGQTAGQARIADSAA